MSASSGILLINLGSPTAPTPTAVQSFLREFLSDPCVVRLPRWLWLPLLDQVILPLRRAKVTSRYRAIWTKAGSPLVVNTLALAAGLDALLAPQTQVVAGMRYGKPSLLDALMRLRDHGVDRLLLAPLYPQASTTTTDTALASARAGLHDLGWQPEVTILKPFFDAPEYIAALGASIRDYWRRHGQGDRLLLSFHGLPRRLVAQGDPYYDQCMATSRQLAAELAVTVAMPVAFQSRFGPGRWLKPATADLISLWGKQGLGRVDVVCPGFSSDCLETLEEIAQREKMRFINAGGGELRYIPCLNAAPDWVERMASLLARPDAVVKTLTVSGGH